eukprot:2567709-Amphidinium_carterae.1
MGLTWDATGCRSSTQDAGASWGTYGFVCVITTARSSQTHSDPLIIIFPSLRHMFFWTLKKQGLDSTRYFGISLNENAQTEA